MGTLGVKKKVCKRGHVNPERNNQGACILCKKLYQIETYQRNREYKIAYAVARSKENPEARRDQQRAHRLRVPVAVVRAVIARANGACEACQLPLTHAKMCIDHCHTTGRVRGVLCIFCNALDGMLNKQADRVEKLKAYLARSSDLYEVKKCG